MLGLADDREPAAPPRVLRFKQAVDEARRLFGVPAAPDDSDKPFTVNDALDQLEAHLRVNRGHVHNVTRVRAHLPAALGGPAA